ncbi:hypothetical protein ATY41_08105 [Leifsonia xyli subsp. xyli]|uniref:Exosortase/archaeosortase family protein n=2 Tax=Leifsonia xyli subsp. xyli TaxID=59736 RepID=Q6AEH9_LEIXX|nr:exosortase R [Leifsonia xyli]AAT89217.1 hypothetical protein Lxx13990 [Leifsonia xyli subsp. xyli str. CTCB07]ODA90868.1 hypothetical protein ATY41_08105 [Leifsonia xyli subsp. xyli]
MSRLLAVLVCIAKMLLAAGIGTIGALVMLNEHTIRTLEAAVTTWLIAHTFAGDTFLAATGGNPSTIYQVAGRWYGMVITSECSIALYAGPILMLAAVFLIMSRFGTIRTLVAAAISVILLAMLNQIRLLGLAYVLSHWGADAFQWWHSLGGSFLMVSGLASILFLFFVMVIRRHRRGRRAAL